MVGQTLRLHRIGTIGIVLTLLFTTSNAQCPNEMNECDCQANADGEIIINCRSRSLDTVPTFSPTTQMFAEISFRRNNIKSLPADALKTTNGEPLNVKKIDFRDNSITSINDNAFNDLGANVKELLLEVDEMTLFPTEALAHLSNLEHLYLEGFDMPILPTNALSSFNTLQILEIINSGLSSLSSSDLSSQRTTLRELHLNRNQFSSIPRDALSTLTSLATLDMTSNNMNTLPNQSFQGMSALQDLNLKQNGLDSVMPGAFTGLELTLKKLDLSLTNYHDSNLNALYILNNLEELILSNNKQIISPSFQGMSSLRMLLLDGCGIETLSSTMFRNMERDNSIEDLDLEANPNFRTINEGALNNLPALGILKLNGNNIGASLTSGMKFSGLEDTLEELYLNGIEMTSDGLKQLQYLAKLRTVTMTSNKITSIPDGTFTYLNRLQTLEMSSNELQTVSQPSLRGLHHNLEEIKLASNMITSLDGCVFSDFKKLKSVIMNNNNIVCDCKIKWLREWSSPSNHELQGTCNAPAEHKDRDISSVAADDFTCDEEYVPPECDSYTTPTLPPTTTSSVSSTTIGPVEQVIVNITDVQADSMLVYWKLPSTKYVSGFHLEIELLETSEKVQEHDFGIETRQATVYGLEAAMTYQACVLVMYSQHAYVLEHRGCNVATTEPAMPPVTDGNDQLALILGCVIGILGFIMLLAILICCIRRCHKKINNDYEKTIPARKDLPQMGYNSKRFSKPSKSMTSLDNLDSKELEKKLEGFTQEERDRILNLLTHSGASTLSMISHASSNRYLDNPPHGSGVSTYPGGASRYPNGQYLNSMGYRNSGAYEEIPADQMNYEYIPADQIGKYDYIPADEVRRIDIPEPVPPTPVPRPEGGSMPPLWGDEGDFAGTSVRRKSDANLAENEQVVEDWI